MFENGKVQGIKAGDQYAKAPIVVCDPSYTTGLPKVAEVGKVLRAMCILTHPIPGTLDSAHCQIIIP